MNIEELSYLNEFYIDCCVSNGTVKEKLTVLKGELGPSLFFANGGCETEEMELSALEAVYLIEHGFDI